MRANSGISLLILLLISAGLSTACVKRTTNTADESAPSETSSSTAQTDDDFKLDEETPSTTNDAQAQSAAAIEATEQASSEMTNTASTESATSNTWDQVANRATVSTLPQLKLTKTTKDYVAKEGDTLMLVSHNVYGDYRRWKNIYRLNKATLTDANQKISAGTIVKYMAPETEYSPVINGEPYLIVEKDTLGKVSKKVYTTAKRWKEIWKNNAYILNPNVIFAGFTLYYVKDTKVAQKQ